MTPTPDRPLVDAIRRAGMRDERVLEAIASVPRDRYVRAPDRGAAELDVPLPIGDEQVTTQPSLVAAIVASLELEGHERVLEVGTGLGYQAAVLSVIAEEVITVERFPELAAQAGDNLDADGRGNVTVVVGDGTLGVPERAPYDAVVVAAAFPEVPPALVEQLRQGGRLVQPIGPGGREDVTLFRKRGDALEVVRRVTGAHFVRLVGEHGFPG